MFSCTYLLGYFFSEFSSYMLSKSPLDFLQNIVTAFCTRSLGILQKCMVKSYYSTIEHRILRISKIHSTWKFWDSVSCFKVICIKLFVSSRNLDILHEEDLPYNYNEDIWYIMACCGQSDSLMEDWTEHCIRGVLITILFLNPTALRMAKTPCAQGLNVWAWV